MKRRAAGVHRSQSLNARRPRPSTSWSRFRPSDRVGAAPRHRGHGRRAAGADEGEAEVRTLGATGEIASVERVTVPSAPGRAVAASGARRRAARALGREPGERPQRRVGTTTSSEGPAAAGAAGGPQRTHHALRNQPLAPLEEAISTTRANAAVVDGVRDADAILTLRRCFTAAARGRCGTPRRAASPSTSCATTASAKSSSRSTRCAGHPGGTDPTTGALREAEEAIAAVAFGRAPQVELSPQSSYLRGLQHELVGRHSQRSVSRGREAYRHVVR